MADAAVMLAPVAQSPELLGCTSEADLLVSALARFSERTAITGLGLDLSYKQLADEIGRYVAALEIAGLKLGARVGLLAGNRPEVVFCNYAILLTGCCLVPLHPRGSHEDHAYIVRDADLDALIYDAALYSRHVAQLETGRCRLFTIGAPEDDGDLGAMAAGASGQPLAAPVLHSDQVVRISYSGGTTGEPKGIIGTPRTLLTKTMIQLVEWEWPDEARQLICAPLSHAGGSMILPTLIRGGSVHIMASFEAGEALALIERERITCVLLVPTMIAALLDHSDIARRDLSSLQVIYYGASPISTGLLRRGLERFGPVFFQFYGQTEAPMTVSVMRRDEHLVDDEERLGSCGRPVPWVRVSIRDDEGREVADGTPGELCVQGPLLMGGYWNKPEQTREALAGAWLHSGDVAVRRPDGFLTIVDRKKDMIISGGFNVFAREVEAVIESCAGVGACAVIGLPDAKWGEVVTAIVVPAETLVPDEAAIIAEVRLRKGAVHAPKRIIIRESLPLTGLGKPDKKRLRAEIGGAA
jgi:fatty-acyl-CoA synthase